MPFDGEVKLPEPAPTPYERWCVIPNRVRAPRPSYQPMSDRDVLLHVLSGVKSKWARRLNGSDGSHCIVGWVVEKSEPTTIIDYSRPQITRLVRRLHDALPPWAQRKRTPPHLTLGKYNDTHSREAVYAVAERAYLKLMDDMVNKANAADVSNIGSDR